jgi:RHS repeat-associated protein
MMCRNRESAIADGRPASVVLLMVALLLAAAIVGLASSTAQAAGSGSTGRMGPASVPTSTRMASSSDGGLGSSGLLGTGFSTQMDFSTEASCDPNTQSCKPPDGGGGGGGGGSGDCPKWKQDLGLCKPGDGGGGTCGPGPGGPPDECSTGPTNSPGGAGGSVNVGGGNPVNLITGNKYQTEVDLPALPGVLGLELTRHFNAMGRYTGLTGSGWRTSYEAVLYDFGALIQITQADGRRITFDRVFDSGKSPHGTLCTASQPTDGQVTIHQRADGKNEYRWRWTDGRVLTFSDGSGGGYPLQSIQAASGEMLSLTYAPKGELVRVRDPQGRSLDFVYDKQVRLQAIVTPVSRVEYTIDATGRLAQVAIRPRPDGRAAQTRPHVRRYHYEDRYNAGWKNVLTGISAVVFDDKGQPSEQRLSTYAYDAQGRAILTTKGSPREIVNGQPKADTGIEQIDLKYYDITAPAEVARLTTGMTNARPRLLSKTTLTNATGQQTEIVSAVIGGHYRLLSMKGPGCSTCGPSNRAYGYDAAGRLLKTTQLDAKGQPQRSNYERHDAYGRLIEQGLQASANAPAQWQMRYRYRDVKFKDGSIALGQQPIVVARPSVVPGRQWLTRLEYNDRGQVLKATDEAWSPVDAGGQETPEGSPIRRTTTFTYTSAEGASVLTRIDGPLPNGPTATSVDSDVTEIRWGPAGRQIEAIVYPLGDTATVETDEGSGRLRKVTGRSGLTDELRYDLFGQIIERTSRRGVQLADGQSWQRDDSGRVIETARLMIGKDGPNWLPQTRVRYDVAGRLLWQAQSRGILSAAEYDAEGRLLSSTITGAGMQQQERYGYDEAGRLQRVSDSTGAVRELLRDVNGRIQATVDPLGRATALQAGAITDAANTAQALNVSTKAGEVRVQGNDGRGGQRQSNTRILRNDFGQVVLEQSDDGGLELRRYDEAGKLVRRSDANGHVTELAYDMAGRLIRKTVSAKAGIPQITNYRYEGQRLVEIEDPVQRERFGFGAQGQQISRAVTLKTGDGKAITMTTTYRYNADGTLIAQTLPDGSELQYERDAFGQVHALYRQPLPVLENSWATSWIANWTRQALASNLQRDLTGVRHITYGNGIEGQWQRSAEGILARVVYRRTGTPQAPSGLRAWIERTIPSANAQSGKPAPTAAPAATAAPAPGALNEPEDTTALWDSRLLYDSAGNLIVVRDSGAVVNSQARWNHYSYDNLNQLIQAWQTTRSTNTTLAQSVNDPDTNIARVWRYHQDSLGNRLLMQNPAEGSDMPLRKVSINAEGGQAESPLLKMSYADQGNTLMAVAAGNAEATAGALSTPSTGLPGEDPAHNSRQWLWNPDGTLRAVLQDGKELARYAYNHDGLRVAKAATGQATQYTVYDGQRNRVADMDAKGRITRQYVWIGDQLLAMLDAPEPQTPPSDQAVGIFTTIAAAWQHFAGEELRVSYVHVNHLGAPIAVTDTNANTIWQAQYTPYGQRVEDQGEQAAKRRGTHLDLRLPGQWADEETGLHYNDQRYYDPKLGRYISADPLGLRGGLNRYAYVGNNPLGFTDPLGLVLFAFDGTGNDESTPNELSNVVRFRELYQDGERFYITGPGTLDPRTSIGPTTAVGRAADTAMSRTGKERVARLIQDLQDYSETADDETAVDIDVIGFSRGAAQARDFANQVVMDTKDSWYQYTRRVDGQDVVRCQKVNLRFIGIWDTVLSFHTGSYSLGIPDSFSYVAHAVALNEYRSIFPSESIMQGPYSSPARPGLTRIERGFLGSHSDVGGSFPERDLAKVAMVWMRDQAAKAGVNMLEPERNIIANPVLHDKSSNLYAAGGPAPTPFSEDRVIRWRSAAQQRQRQTSINGVSYSDVAPFINYSGNPRGIIAGTVDMRGYLDWLNRNDYSINMTVN